MELKGKASLNPWHIDRYVIQTGRTIDELREYVRLAPTRSESLEWRIGEDRRRGLQFWAWRTDYIGPFPVRSVAECFAQEADGATIITVSVKVADTMLMFAFLAAAAGLATFYTAPGVDREWFVPVTIGWVALLYIELRQVRRRDPPQALAARLTASFGGVVENAHD